MYVDTYPLHIFEHTYTYVRTIQEDRYISRNIGSKHLGSHKHTLLAIRIRTARAVVDTAAAVFPCRLFQASQYQHLRIC